MKTFISSESTTFITKQLCDCSLKIICIFQFEYVDAAYPVSSYTADRYIFMHMIMLIAKDATLF